MVLWEAPLPVQVFDFLRGFSLGEPRGTGCDRQRRNEYPCHVGIRTVNARRMFRDEVRAAPVQGQPSELWPRYMYGCAIQMQCEQWCMSASPSFWQIFNNCLTSIRKKCFTSCETTFNYSESWPFCSPSICLPCAHYLPTIHSTICQVVLAKIHHIYWLPHPNTNIDNGTLLFSHLSQLLLPPWPPFHKLVHCLSNIFPLFEIVCQLLANYLPTIHTLLVQHLLTIC